MRKQSKAGSRGTSAGRSTSKFQSPERRSSSSKKGYGRYVEGSTSERGFKRGRSAEKESRPGKRGTAKKNLALEPRIVKHRGPWADSAYRTSNTSVPPVLPKKPRAAAAAETKPKLERLQKVLARAGVASRRNAELLILEGAVTINAKPVTELGTKVDVSKDKIKVNGRLIFTDIEPVYLALYKPKGMISSFADPEGRRHIGHILASIKERLVSIGRLDYNSEGLMLLTNDGDMAEKIMKARNLPKVYMVKIKGHPIDKDLDFLKRGIFSAEGVVRFASFGIEQSLRNKSWLKLEVTEGSKLDLRELLNHRGLLVDRIVRTAIGTISIKGIEPGTYRVLKRSDFERVLASNEDQKQAAGK